MGIKYTRGEERANYLSHGGGILLGIAVGIGLLIYCYRNDNVWMEWGVWLYLVGMLGSYIASTVYHACSPHSVWKERLRKWDHAAIYWHIAGSYSPITLVALRDSGYWGWTLFIFVWLCAIVGTIISFRKLKEHSNVETICYVLMGLTIVVAMKQFYDSVALSVFLWIVGEGIAYILGAVLYSMHKIKYVHFVFHLFVLLGTLCHMIAVQGVIDTM
jgi:hemolysin III